MKRTLISKLKEPAQNGAEPTEEELSARYEYFKRRNKIGICLWFVGIVALPVSLMATLELADRGGALVDDVLMGCLIPCALLMALGLAMLDHKKEISNMPLADLSEKDQAEAARLIRFVPEARKLNERARRQGRALRASDLEAMEAFEKQRNEKRLLRQGNRLKIQDQGVSKTEA